MEQETFTINKTTTEDNWTNIELDSQILSSFMACPREMKLRFMEHLVPLGGISKSIEKGILMHKALQVFYELMRDNVSYDIRRLAGKQAIREFAPTLNKLEGDDVVKCVDTFHEYTEYRKGDVFHVVFTERHFKFIAYEDAGIRLRIILTGRIDLGVLDNSSNKIIPYDHKTESEHWFYSSLSNQFKIYALACNSQRLVVNRIGFQDSVKIEKKFKREDISFDQDCLDEFKYEVLPYYAKQLLVAIEDDYFAPNYTNCIKGHWGCIFSDRYDGGVCNQHRLIRPEKLRRYFTAREWDPSDEAI